MKVYLDSVILVYFLDHVGEFQMRAARRLAAIDAAADLIAVSDLVRMECRMDPLRKGDAVRLARFDGFFERTDIECILITSGIFDRATEIRATLGFKSIDALHLAAALEGGCDVFLTNDIQLQKFSQLNVEILP